MMNNYHARKFELTSDINTAESSYDLDESENEDDEINPMDALLAIFYHSDNSLRRYLALKLSACQLSVPFLLPDLEGASDKITILLSSLEDITKSWSDLSDVFATEHPFPIVSFIRIGEITQSKSSLINQIMSDGRKHDLFFHKNLEGGDIERKIVDGLVELGWYLPGGDEKRTFKTEICFMNLRGDAKDFKKQRSILSKISSVLCVLLPSEYPDESSKRLLEEAMDDKTKTILIFLKKAKPETKKYFEDLESKHRNKLSSMTRPARANEHKFVKIVQERIEKSVHEIQATPLRYLVAPASNDDDETCLKFEKNMDEWLKTGVKEAKDLLKLQLHVPKLAELERERYQPKSQGGKSIKDDMDKIYESIIEEKAAQKETFKLLDPKVLECLNSIAVMNESERDKALKKLKHQLDKMVLRVMAESHAKDQKKNVATLEELNEKRLKQFEEKSKFSFGLEHIIRELAQLYQIGERKCDYASAAADMLLSGQPLEILDGDSFYIPQEWFKAVFTKLEYKTNNANIFVISVLGIQSSGKSTMLNTMFGLEFPVSAGRCTRGAFASLLPVSDSFKSTSKFDYVLIVDSEGLRGSGNPRAREKDNELVTFVIGAADLTIVNIMGENHSDMKEFLEIAMHAFLKMKLVKKKRRCKIVHHNVAATDARDKLTADRLKLKKDLDQIVRLAAIYENLEHEFQKLDDILSFDENDDVFYIPSLLEGNPPMAPVNPNYGRGVQKVKESIITLMSSKQDFKLSVSQFRERVCNLWKATLKENFIFHFRNVIEVRAYAALDKKYFEESVKLMVTGMTNLKTKIDVDLGRCATREEREKKWWESEKEIWKEAAGLGKKMEIAMKDFFETNEDKATLEQWRENTMTKIKQMQENQKADVVKHCSATYHYLQSRQDVEDKKQSYENKLLQKAKKFINSAHDNVDAKKCLEEFEHEWKKWIADIPACPEKKNDVNNEMARVLIDTNPALTAEMGTKLEKQNFQMLQFQKDTLDFEIKVTNESILTRFYNYFFQKKPMESRIFNQEQLVCTTAVKSALTFATEKEKSRVRCTRNDLKSMYHKVVTTIDDESKKHKLKFRDSIKCDILLLAFAHAYDILERMETRYLEERDIRGELERNLRPGLERHFRNLCEKMGKEISAATSFVNVLQTKIESALNRIMGPAVAKEVLKFSKFQSKGQFHASILIELGKKGEFESYIPYLENPVEFLQKKLMESIENYCINESPASIISVLEREAAKIKNEVSAGILSANKKTKIGGEKLNFWIHQYVKECSSLEITKDMFKVAAIYEDLKDIEVFENKVRENIDKFLESLIKRGINRRIMKQWQPSPHDQLLNYMFGCQSCCPFCNGLCDQTIQNHPGSHSTKSHRARGLSGYRNIETQILCSSICTNAVADEDARFKNPDTNWEFHYYSDYQSVNDYYKSWSIPPDKSFELSIYWQWFMAKFSKDLCEYYEVEEPEIPPTWKNRSFEEAEHDLRQEYNMELIVNKPKEPSSH